MFTNKFLSYYSESVLSDNEDIDDEDPGCISEEPTEWSDKEVTMTDEGNLSNGI